MEQGDKTVSSKMDTKIFKMFSVEKNEKLYNQ